jgi:hypothetical protein
MELLALFVQTAGMGLEFPAELIGLGPRDILFPSARLQLHR